ncbi:hypothetical protein AGMMS50293_19900 [Spirochaetia bacterium]|nr:hypothetical protein AGMMS50293_19900 [Spirochaetia bacterium]
MYHYAGNNPLKYTDPNGRADRYYIEINAGSATFVMGNSGKFSINYSDKINVSVSYTDKNKISVILPPNSTISILANSGSGKLTIANPNTSARAIDLGYSIDAYEKYQVNIGNNINVLQNLIKKDVDSAWESLSDFTASYFFGVLSYAVGLDPASIIGEGLAADPKPIDNLINIYNSMKTANKRALESNLQDIAYKRRIWINLE